MSSQTRVFSNGATDSSARKLCRHKGVHTATCDSCDRIQFLSGLAEKQPKPHREVLARNAKLADEHEKHVFFQSVPREPAAIRGHRHENQSSRTQIWSHMSSISRTSSVCSAANCHTPASTLWAYRNGLLTLEFCNQCLRMTDGKPSARVRDGPSALVGITIEGS